MIRPARFGDEPVIAAMLREMHRESKYLGIVDISEKAMERVILSMIAGQGQSGPQGTFCVVAEQGGRAAGFMAGILDRIYHIGDKLVAQDVFLHVRHGSGPRPALKLIDAYVEWARGNRKVLEVKLSWNDTLPGAKRIAPIYERKGFRRCGEIYEMRSVAPEPARNVLLLEGA